ncbi:MAG TPA: SDR family oxidoreductase [Nocardioidaceae bacterium]|nr:SDR family oxidoreductase [Nocardioidaceae bacterium]
MGNPVLVVVGAGPGVGASVARRFGAEGYAVALVSRSPERLATLAAQLQATGVPTTWTACDITDQETFHAAVTGFGEQHERIDVVHFNPSIAREKDALTLSPEELLEDVRLGVAPLLTAVQAARPFFRPGSRVLATGSRSADRPWSQAASLGVQKAGLRNLVRSLDATLRAEGVRAVSLTVNGSLAAGTAFDPDRVADALLAASRQEEGSWRSEVGYDG